MMKNVNKLHFDNKIDVYTNLSWDFFTGFYYFSGRIKHINQSKFRRLLDFRVAFFNKFGSTFIFINGGTFFVMNGAENVQMGNGDILVMSG